MQGKGGVQGMLRGTLLLTVSVDVRVPEEARRLRSHAHRDQDALQLALAHRAAPVRIRSEEGAHEPLVLALRPIALRRRRAGLGELLTVRAVPLRP